MLLPLRQDGARVFVRSAPPILRLMIALLAVGGAVAQAARAAEPGVSRAQWQLASGEERCWEAPASETIEEALKTSGNQRARGRAQRGVRRAILLMSSADLKAAYAAGLLVGWGETGDRPRFDVVTAVGVSALIAPFAFLGPAGDRKIADIFNCGANDLDSLAERAASYLDDKVLAAIAREHETGRRLLVALPGSAARSETVWDIGRLAASRHPDAASHLRKILLATVDWQTFVDPNDAPAAAGQVVERNFTFRTTGAGEQFLFPSELARSSGEGTAYYLIHNERIFPDESADYIRTRVSSGNRRSGSRAVVPAHDVIRHSLSTNSGFRFASIKLRLGLIPQAAFDMAYIQALFRHAYRQGRMGKEWKSAFPGLPLSHARQPR